MPDSKRLPSRLSRSPRLIVALGLFGVSCWLLANRNHVDEPGRDASKGASQNASPPTPAADARGPKAGGPDLKP